MANEVREGAAAGRRAAYVMLNLTTWSPRNIDAKLPDITEFARTYWGWEPTSEQIPVFPTAHYAMGGIPDDILGEALANTTTSSPPVRRGRGRLRLACTGRTGWARTPCSTSTVFGRRRGSRPRSTRGPRRFEELPADPETFVVDLIEGLRNARRRRAGGRDPLGTCRRRWT